MDLVDNLRYSYVSDDSSGPVIEGMITFMCGCPELCPKTDTLTIFRRGYLCVSHFPTLRHAMQIGLAVSSSEGPNSAQNIEPVRNYMLSCNPENKIFTNPESINSYVELLDTFAATALRSGYDAWSYVDNHKKERILMSLIREHRRIRSAAGVDDAIFSSVAPETLCRQHSNPILPTCVNAAKTLSLFH